MRFRYEEEEILAHSLTSTNFHTYYQGSEMVVAGRIPQSNEIIEYEILATQAEGTQYKVHGSYNGSKVLLKCLTIKVRQNIEYGKP